MKYICKVSFWSENSNGNKKRKISSGSLWETNDLVFNKNDKLCLKRFWRNNSSKKTQDLIISKEKLQNCFEIYENSENLWK